jgi:hypothetical protein
MKAILALAILAITLGAPTANAKGNKSDVVVTSDVALGTVNIMPSKCYHKGLALTWTICPQLFEKLDGSEKQFFLYILLAQFTETAFPGAFTSAGITINTDGDVQSTGYDIEWTYGNGGKFVHIPITKDYLEHLKVAHEVYFVLQLPGTAARSDIHLDDKGLRTLQAACGAIITYSQGEQPH